MTIWNRALLKMTTIYAAILLALCVGFSISIYAIACREIDRERPLVMLPGTVIDRKDLRTIIHSRNLETKESLVGQIIVINIIVMTIGVGVSYLLARITLAPIQKAYKAQAAFVSDASHELRTPLTAISMESEVLLRDPSATKDDFRSQVESNLEETRKLQSLTNTLLQLSRAEKTKPSDTAVILEQIISILVDNAKKYSPEGSPVKVIKKKHLVEVIDQGPGIAEEDLPHIFERFYRADKSRSTEGYGLGLALAQALAEQIGARITVRNNKGKGATFSVELQH